MVLGLTIYANGWMVALAVVVVVGLRVIFWHRTGKVMVNHIGSIEMKADEAAVKADDAAVRATAAREAAVVTSLKTDNIQSSIGVPNGQGPVVDMIEKLMESQAGLHHRVSEIENRSMKRHDENRAMIALLGAKVSDIGTRLDEAAS